MSQEAMRMLMSAASSSADMKELMKDQDKMSLTDKVTPLDIRTAAMLRGSTCCMCSELT